jgi:hypothetical protein
VPEDGNKEVKSMFWTAAELKQHDKKICGWARWEVDQSAYVVRSTKCTRLMTNRDEICDECHEVSRDESFKSDVRKVWIQWSVEAKTAIISNLYLMQKNREAKLPMDQQAAKHVAQVKYAPLTLISVEACALQLKLKDPLLFNAFQLLEKGEDTGAFLQLYKYAKEGKLKGYDTFTEICEVLADCI